MKKYFFYFLAVFLILNCSSNRLNQNDKVLSDVIDNVLIDSYLENNKNDKIGVLSILNTLNEDEISVIEKSVKTKFDFSNLKPESINNLKSGSDKVSFEILKKENTQNMPLMEISKIYYNKTEDHGVFLYKYLCGEMCGKEEFIFIKSTESKSWVIYDRMVYAEY